MSHRPIGEQNNKGTMGNYYIQVYSLFDRLLNLVKHHLALEYSSQFDIFGGSTLV